MATSKFLVDPKERVSKALLLSRLTGMLVADKDLNFSYGWLVYSVFFVGVVFLVAAYFYTQLYLITKSDGSFLVAMFAQSSWYVFIFLCYLLGLRVPYRLKRCLSKLERVGLLEMGAVLRVPSTGLLRAFVTPVIFVGVSSYFELFDGGMSSRWTNFGWSCVSIITWMMADSLISQFTLLLALLESGFSFVETKFRSASLGLVRKKESVERLVRAHSYLTTLTVYLNDIYSLQILLLITMDFITTVSGTYVVLQQAIYVFSPPVEPEELLNLLAYLFWTVTCFLQMLKLVSSCINTADQVSHLSRLAQPLTLAVWSMSPFYNVILRFSGKRIQHAPLSTHDR